MERILVFLVVMVTVTAFRHPKFPKVEETAVGKQVSCSLHEDKRSEIINKSKCGEPKEVFVELKPLGSYLKVRPSWVWVKRCVGLCDEGPNSSKCIAKQVKKESIPVRILNLKTHKEFCTTYEVDVHESCGCGCDNANEECVSPRVYNPRKCSCQCPDMRERRNCLKKRNQNMRWNPYKCVCERRRR